MNFPLEQNISNLEGTNKLAEELSRELRPGKIVVLNGNLGSGKTTLIKAICKQFDISDSTSPSFSIVNEYTGKYKIYHFDFYRLKRIEELYDIGFEDYLNDSDAIIFIEWGDLFPDIIPSKNYQISLELSTQNTRIAKIIKKN